MTSSVPSPEKLIELTYAFVENYMSQPQFDASHDFSHIRRVVKHAHEMLASESVSQTKISFDPTTVTLSALLHDIADHKYAGPELSEHNVMESHTPLSFLLSISCPPELARSVQEIVNAVSYTHELRSSALTQSTLKSHPELAIVQDADRLDALGATAIGRFFSFGGAAAGKGRSMAVSMYHMMERSEKVMGMMKTEEGKRLAEVKMDRLRVYQGWWDEEVGPSLNPGFS